MLVEASSTLATEPLDARVILVVTDGNETRSAASAQRGDRRGTPCRGSDLRRRNREPEVQPRPSPQARPRDRRRVPRDRLERDDRRPSTHAIASELRRTWRLEYADGDPPRRHGHAPGVLERSELRAGDSSACQAAWARVVTTPSRHACCRSVFYKTVLGTQVMALISFFIVLIGASLALTTVKGARLKKRLAPHLVTSTEIRKRKEERRSASPLPPVSSGQPRTPSRTGRSGSAWSVSSSEATYRSEQWSSST